MSDEGHTIRSELASSLDDFIDEYMLENVTVAIEKLHQQELERAVAEAKEAHEHDYHFGGLSYRHKLAPDRISIASKTVIATFVCTCGDFKYVSDSIEIEESPQRPEPNPPRRPDGRA